MNTFRIFSLLLLLLLRVPLIAQVPQAEKDALIALYNATDGENWTTNTNWLIDEDVSTWFGVGVIDDHVFYLSLFINNLVGELPFELGDLSYLQTLNLAYSSLSGPIPEEIGNLVNLVDLRLDGNQLSGSIPNEIGNCTSLTSLNLNLNQLSGDLPEEIWSLSALTIIRLAGNQLSGILPESFATFENLEWLNLNSNLFEGSIPDNIGQNSALTYLGLNNNLLTGSIPTSIGDLINLVNLQLAANSLSGEIPSEIGNLVNLQTIDFQLNQLSGELPVEMGNMTSLQELKLQGNQLSGSIPPELGNMTSLGYLALNNNQFLGEIPSELSNLINLYDLGFSSNQFTGVLPDELAELSNLIYIELSHNEFVGLPDFSSIEGASLSMDHNKFTFEDIEPQLALVDLEYSPQALIPGVDPIILNAGEILAIFIPVGGSANVYQWYKDGELLDGQNSDQLFITDVDASDAGYYTMQITNTLATELVLETEEMLVDIITGITEESKTKVEVYPNPVKDKMTLSFDQNNSEIKTITVLDLSGKVCFSEAYNGDHSSNYILDVSRLNSGYYTLRIDGELDTMLLKFVKE